MPETLEFKIKRIISENFGVPQEEVGVHSTLKDLGELGDDLASEEESVFDLAEIDKGLMHEFDFFEGFTDKDLDTIKNVGDIIEAVKKQAGENY